MRIFKGTYKYTSFVRFPLFNFAQFPLTKFYDHNNRLICFFLCRILDFFFFLDSPAVVELYLFYFSIKICRFVSSFVFFFFLKFNFPFFIFLILSNVFFSLLFIYFIIFIFKSLCPFWSSFLKSSFSPSLSLSPPLSPSFPLAFAYFLFFFFLFFCFFPINNSVL